MNIRHNIKRVMLLAVLLLTVGSVANANVKVSSVANANVKVSRVADATKAVSKSKEILYVITDDNSHFLAVENGELTTATTFNPNTCVWTCSATGGGTMSIGGKYLSCTTDGSLSLTNSNTYEWTVNGDGSVSWTSESTSYYIYYGGSWTTSTSLSDITAASCYSTTLATNDAVSAMTLNYDEFTSSSFGRFNGDTRTYNIGNFSYTPAYCVYSWMNKSGVQKVFYTNEDKSMVTTTAPKDFSLSDASITWTSSHSNVTITADGDDASKAEAKYATKFSADTEVTFTATATIAATKSDYISSDVTLTATDKVTMYKLLANKLELSFALDNDKHDKLYVNETATLTVATNTSGGAVTYKLSDAAIATLDETGKLTANGVNEANGANEAVLVVTATTPETDEYEAGSATIHVTVSKRPTDIDFSYSGNSLTYGDAAPTLTTIRVNDELANDALESPTLRYSSNNECVGVDASTGALTIDHAGTATITATYAGDGTYASSTATYQITVSKCATTLTFPAEAYYAQVGKDFTSPVATLTPSGAGSVTYSYTSETAGLLSLDAETGEVTINTTTGTAIITATFAGNSSYEAATASYTLLVDMKELPELTVNIESNTFYVEKTSTVTATTNASNGVKFESTDTDVFTITSDGAFTAVAEGQATLRITSVEDDTYMEYVVEMPITVKRYPVNLTLSYPQSTYYTDHGVDNIIPTVIAKDGVTEFSVDGQITFSTAQTSVVTVDATTGRVALVAPGNAVVTVSYAGTDHYSPTTATFSILVKYAAGPGQFVRLKDADGNYMSCNHGSGIGTTTDKDASTIIWYGTDRSLLFYSCGRYLKNADKELAEVVNAGQAGPTFLFTHNGDDYTISDGTKNMPSGTSDDGVWIVETVDELPLTFSEGGYGYSTFYSPVNLRCPAGVTAYYPSARNAGTDDVDYVITLKSVTGNYIPSNTPVVLYTQTIGTYRMSQIEAEQTTYTDLWDGMKGTLPMVNTASVYSGTQCPYTLQANTSSSSVGFYPWTSEHNTISAFRCYIPGESVSDAKSFRFVFDGNTTGIDNVNVDSPDSSSTIYNLHGVAVGTDFNTLPSGVYIRGGKKMMKK